MVEANEELDFRTDLENYRIVSQILLILCIQKINLLTNNPKKILD